MKIRNVTRCVKEAVVLTPEQFPAIAPRLPQDGSGLCEFQQLSLVILLGFHNSLIASSYTRCAVIQGSQEETSANVVTVKDNSKVKKGDQLGYFQFGGSTHCLVFGKGVISEFAAHAIPQGLNGEDSAIVKVNSLLAVVN